MGKNSLFLLRIIADVERKVKSCRPPSCHPERRAYARSRTPSGAQERRSRSVRRDLSRGSCFLHRSSVLLNTEQPSHRNIQDLGDLAQLIIRHKTGADLNARNAITLDNDSRDLQARREIALCQPMAAPRLMNTVTANVFLPVVIVYLHKNTPKIR